MSINNDVVHAGDSLSSRDPDPVPGYVPGHVDEHVDGYVDEQLRLLTLALCHLRQAQASVSRVDVMMRTMPGMARDQAVEACDQADHALRHLVALEKVIKTARAR